jgi:hypothetical protein
LRDHTAVIEALLAGIVLAACAALLLRMALPERQRLLHSGRAAARRLWFWRSRRQTAAREAEEAIRRAQRKGRRDGNVIHPDSFKGPRKPH